MLTAHLVIDGSCVLDGYDPWMVDQLQAGAAGNVGVAVEHCTVQLEPSSHADHEAGLPAWTTGRRSIPKAGCFPPAAMPPPSTGCCCAGGAPGAGDAGLERGRHRRAGARHLDGPVGGAGRVRSGRPGRDRRKHCRALGAVRTGEDRQRRALRLIAYAFLALAGYLTVRSTVVLAAGYHPRHSRLGIGWTATTAGVMFTLAAGKTRTGRALGNPVLTGEGRVTLVDALLATAVLLGLVLNTLVGVWWADPLAGLVIVFYGLREARSILTARH